MGRRAGVTAEETREQLLEATMRVLLRRGFSGTRVSEIAQEAGIQAGSIYNHFASKADLLMAAISAHAPNAIGDLLAAGGRESVLDTFGRMGARLGDPAELQMAPVMMELIVTSERDPEVASVVRDAFGARERELTDVVRLGQDNGEIDRSLDPEALARFLSMVVMGSTAVAALGLKEVDPDAWAVVVGCLLDATRPGRGPSCA